MSHFVYIRTSTSGVWATLQVPSPSDLTLFDQQLFKAINGDDGGVWAPASHPVEIGGQGVKLATCAGGFTHVLDDHLVGTSLAAIILPAGAYYQAAHASDYHVPTVTRTVSIAPVPIRIGVGGGYPGSTTFTGWGWYADSAWAMRGDGTATEVHVDLTPYLQDGALIVSLDLAFAVRASHITLPASYGTAQLARIAADGTVEYMTGAAAPLPASTPASLLAYLDGGAWQTLHVVPTDHNVVDKSQYAYRLIIHDENNATGGGSASGGLTIGMVQLGLSYSDLRPG